MSLDESWELTKRSTRGSFVLHVVVLLGFGDERLTWCACGSVMRLNDLREAGDVMI